MRAVLAAVIALAAARMVSLCDLADKINNTARLHPHQAAYDLKKLRGRTWCADELAALNPLPESLQNMAALLILREKVLKPVLAGAGNPKRGRKPKHQSQTDLHYANMQTEMRHLFQTIGLAM
jgi:hypothetical protein